jgi:hypothetical protein
MRTNFTESDSAAFAPSEKIGLVATLTEAGEPHLTLLSTLMASGPAELTIGEFSRGESKKNMAARPKVGFLVMSLDRRLWRGRAIWKRLAKDGPEYIVYNKQPMFRYNTYFGINTVHYLDLAGLEGPSPLPMADIVRGSLATMIKAKAAKPSGGVDVLPPFARSILDKFDSLNFLSYVDAEGFPRIIPAIQARSAGNSRIVFTPSAYREELSLIPEAARTAVFSMNLGMESFMARGRFTRVACPGLLAVDLDYLYNSAPPCHGQVYPPLKLEAMTEF